MRWMAYPAPPDRGRRMRLFAAEYGMPEAQSLVDVVIEVQREGRRAVADLASAGREPQASWVAEGHLDELDARVAWSEANRHLFD